MLLIHKKNIFLCILVILSIIVDIVTSVDYYKILGVKRNADEKQIKKQYRRLAKKWHPDKNLNNKEEASKKFAEIAEAYEVLSDPEKRKVFDELGEEGLKHGGSPDSSGFSGQSGFQGSSFRFTRDFQDPFDLGGSSFQQFGGFGGNSGFGRNSQNSQPRQRHATKMYSSADEVEDLQKSSFPNAKNNGQKYIYIVQYYINDQQSVSAKESFLKAGESLRKNGIRLGAVNCAVEKGLCSSVRQYPSYKLVQGSRIIDMNATSSPTPKEIYDFVYDHISVSITNIRLKSQVDEFISKSCTNSKVSSLKIGIVLFTSKFDTSLSYKSLAYRLHGKVALAEVRGSNDHIAKYFELGQEYPTIVVVCGGNEVLAHAVYEDNLKDMDKIESFAMKFQTGSKCKDLQSKAAKLRKTKLEAKKQILHMKESALYSKSIKELRSILETLEISQVGLYEKSDFINAIQKYRNSDL